MRDLNSPKRGAQDPAGYPPAPAGRLGGPQDVAPRHDATRVVNNFTACGFGCLKFKSSSKGDIDMDIDVELTLLSSGGLFRL